MTLERLRLVTGGFKVHHQSNRGRDEEGRSRRQQAREQADEHSERHDNIDDGDDAAGAEVVAVFFLLLVLTSLEFCSQSSNVNFRAAFKFARFLQLGDATLFRPT